jgi:TPR repeat protein
MKKLTIALALLTALSLPVMAQDFQKGLDAFVDRDYAAALKEWRPLAESGGQAAQRNLGFMYQGGWGVLQDNVMAHMWYNIASANGYSDTVGEIN